LFVMAAICFFSGLSGPALLENSSTKKVGKFL